MTSSIVCTLLLVAAANLAVAAPDPVRINTAALQLTVYPENGSFELLDKAGGVTWRSDPYHVRFGEATVRVKGEPRRVDLGACQARKDDLPQLTLTFRPIPEQPDLWLRVVLSAKSDPYALDVSYEKAPDLAIETVRLLDDAFWVTDSERGYAVV